MKHLLNFEQYLFAFLLNTNYIIELIFTLYYIRARYIDLNVHNTVKVFIYYQAQ
jgi:hypothetical protein